MCIHIHTYIFIYTHTHISNRSEAPQSIFTFPRRKLLATTDAICAGGCHDPCAAQN